LARNKVQEFYATRKILGKVPFALMAGVTLLVLTPVLQLMGIPSFLIVLLIGVVVYFMVSGQIPRRFSMGGRVRYLCETDLIAKIDKKGLDILSARGTLKTIKWKQVRSVEIPALVGGSGKSFVNFRNAKGQKESLELPLLFMDQVATEEFFEALRRHWPGIDTPWQEQLASQG